MKTKLIPRIVFAFAILVSPLFPQVRWDLGSPGGTGAASVSGTGQANLVALPNVSLNWCNYPANAIPCTNFATTYTSLTLATACLTSTPIVLQGSSTCQATSDGYGNLGVYTNAGTYSYTLTSNGVTYGPYTVTLGGGGGGTPGGLTSEVQINLLGAFYGSPYFTWNNSTDQLTVGNPASSGGVGIGTPALNGIVIADGETSSGDLGAQIALADTALGARAGQIWITVSGTISEAALTLSVNHDLVCVGDNVVITMAVNAYLKHSNNTRIRNCTFTSTQTSPPLAGAEIYASGVSNVEVSNVTFIGGGGHILYNNVNEFRITDTRHTSATAVASLVEVANSSQGQISGTRVESFVMPSGSLSGNGGVIEVYGSNSVSVSDVHINGVDASTISGGMGGIDFQGVTNSSITAPVITNTKNMDAVLLESAGASPNTDIVITGVVASGNDDSAGIGSNNNLGSGLDIIDSARVVINGCNVRNNGNYASNRQEGIFIFLDDTVNISNCEVSNSGNNGLDVWGSPHTHIVDSRFNNNAFTGAAFAQQTGHVDVRSGTSVTWCDASGGGAGAFATAWTFGTAITIGGTASQIIAVPSNTTLSLGTAVTNSTGATCSSPQVYTVNSYDAQVIGGTALDNGVLGTNPYGIMFEAGTAGLITGVTLGDNDVSGSKTQTYGVFVSAGGSADLDNNDLNGGCSLCANATAPTTGVILSSLPTAALGVGKKYFIQDSTTVSAEGQTCVGSSSHNAIAISDGVTWKCF